MSPRWPARCAIAFFGAVVAACAAAAPPHSIDGHAVVAVDAAPVEIERYPRARWHGRWAYLVDGAWWYPTDTGWVIFRDVPAELRTEHPSVSSGPAGAAIPMQGPYGGGPPPILGPPETPSDPPRQPGDIYPH
jgi:hypothetical protein